MADTDQFVTNMQTAREYYDWSQAELARRLQAKGLSNFHAATVGRVEKRQRQVRLDEAPAIARLFGVSVEQMLMPSDRFEVAMEYGAIVATLERLDDALFNAGKEYEAARRWATKFLDRSDRNDTGSRLLYFGSGLTSEDRDRLRDLTASNASEQLDQSYREAGFEWFDSADGADTNDEGKAHGEHQ